MSTQTQPDTGVSAETRDALLSVRGRLTRSLTDAKGLPHPAAAGTLEGEVKLAIEDINGLLYDADGHLRDAA